MVLIELAKLVVHVDWGSHVFLQLERDLTLRTDVIYRRCGDPHAIWEIVDLVVPCFRKSGEPCFVVYLHHTYLSPWFWKDTGKRNYLLMIIVESKHS